MRASTDGVPATNVPVLIWNGKRSVSLAGSRSLLAKRSHCSSIHSPTIHPQFSISTLEGRRTTLLKLLCPAPHKEDLRARTVPSLRARLSQRRVHDAWVSGCSKLPDTWSRIRRREVVALTADQGYADHLGRFPKAADVQRKRPRQLDATSLCLSLQPGLTEPELNFSNKSRECTSRWRRLDWLHVDVFSRTGRSDDHGMLRPGPCGGITKSEVSDPPRCQEPNSNFRGERIWVRNGR